MELQKKTTRESKLPLKIKNRNKLILILIHAMGWSVARAVHCGFTLLVKVHIDV